jgi:hypothetical protein
MNKEKIKNRVMKKVFILFAVSLFLLSCAEKEVDNRTRCQKENIGYLAFRNTSNHAYDVFIDGVFDRQMPGNTISSRFKEMPAGKAYTVRVQQVAGYIISPTVRTYNVTINMCDEKYVTFP